MTTAKDILANLANPTEADALLITKAYDVAKEAHKNQKRKSGEPYIIHPVAIALRLAQMGMGPRTISAGLLHDTIEDTDITAEDIKDAFGEEILFLVEGVTKLSSVRYYGSDRHNESLRKLFVATSQDIRVLIVKLVDRLHNMETLNHVAPEKQLRIATETLEIYVPVAHRLGMGRIRKELEDLAFPYVYPEEFKRVQDLVKTKADKAQGILEKERKALQKRLADVNLLNFHSSYRVKGWYSLYQKLRRKDWDLEKVFDLMAMRVVVGSVEECYRTLGIIHELWRPLPKRVKDYIAFPKPNGYKSIHTTVATTNGTILEIQIRTEQMHHEAEYGIASHIMYKNRADNGSGQKNVNQHWFSKLIPSLFRPFAWREAKQEKVVNIKSPDHTEKIPQWISEIGEMYTIDQSSGQEFVDDMRRDFFSSRIFVFTPNGDVVDLPVYSTPIDFAYAIHSQVGDRTSAAKINNKLVSLDTELKNGDIIEIETSKNAKPTSKWLDIAKTSLAKRRIKVALSHEGPN